MMVLWYQTTGSSCFVCMYGLFFKSNTTVEYNTVNIILKYRVNPILNDVPRNIIPYWIVLALGHGVTDKP